MCDAPDVFLWPCPTCSIIVQECSGKFSGNFQEIPGKCAGTIQDISGKFPGHFRANSRNISGNVHEISRKVLRHFQEISSNFSGNFLINPFKEGNFIFRLPYRDRNLQIPPRPHHNIRASFLKAPFVHLELAYSWCRAHTMCIKLVEASYLNLDLVQVMHRENKFLLGDFKKKLPLIADVMFLPKWRKNNKDEQKSKTPGKNNETSVTEKR